MICNTSIEEKYGGGDGRGRDFGLGSRGGRYARFRSADEDLALQLPLGNVWSCMKRYRGPPSQEATRRCKIIAPDAAKEWCGLRVRPSRLRRAILRVVRQRRRPRHATSLRRSWKFAGCGLGELLVSMAVWR